FGFREGWWIWVALAACGVLLIPVYGRWLHGAGRLAALGVGLQVGGALANVLDRLLLGGASDVLYLGGLLTWNLADVALLGGTLIATRALARTLVPTGLERSCLATAGCESPHQRRTPHELILHRRLVRHPHGALATKAHAGRPAISTLVERFGADRCR